MSKPHNNENTCKICFQVLVKYLCFNLTASIRIHSRTLTHPQSIWLGTPPAAQKYTTSHECCILHIIFSVPFKFLLHHQLHIRLVLSFNFNSSYPTSTLHRESISSNQPQKKKTIFFLSITLSLQPKKKVVMLFFLLRASIGTLVDRPNLLGALNSSCSHDLISIDGCDTGQDGLSHAWLASLASLSANNGVESSCSVGTFGVHLLVGLWNDRRSFETTINGASKLDGRGSSSGNHLSSLRRRRTRSTTSV